LPECSFYLCYLCAVSFKQEVEDALKEAATKIDRLEKELQELKGDVHKIATKVETLGETDISPNLRQLMADIGRAVDKFAESIAG
jgi:uncharacterized protein YoxC